MAPCGLALLSAVLNGSGLKVGCGYLHQLVRKRRHVGMRREANRGQNCICIEDVCASVESS